MKGGPQTWGEFEKKSVSVTRACISLDGTRIAAVFADKTLCVYDATTGEVILPPFKLDGNPWSVAFSRDGKLAASGGQVLRLWNVQTGEEVESFDIRVKSLAFSPDGTCIAVGCEGKDIDDEDSDGRGSYNIRVINLELAKASYFHTRMFIPSGREGIKLLKGEVPPSPFEGHEFHVVSLAYSPDGKRIASSSKDGEARVWDVSTGESRRFDVLVHSFVTEDWVRTVAFSPDGTKLVSDTALFDLSTGSCTRGAFGDIFRMVISIAFSADGRFVASGSSDATFQIWDTSTHQPIAHLVGHTGGVSSVYFFPDGKQMMSASEDGTIRVWNIDPALLEEGPWKEMDDWQLGSNLEVDLDGPGWIANLKEECLFWTPLPFRHIRNTLVIGQCLEIDFSNFVHGDDWVKCRKPLKSKLEETGGSARDWGDW